MMKKYIVAILTALCIFACGERKPVSQEVNSQVQQNEPGDSTVYGLACDGCTDSILVLLPVSGADPDTFDIIRAHQQHLIYGRPQVGDELALILNPEDKAEALMVIDIEELKGQWCYQVMPTFRNLESMPQRMQRRMMAQMPDSVKAKLLVPREYSIRLKRGNVAQSYGFARHRSADEMSPVEYPKMKRYAGWKLFNGRLILVTDTTRLSDNNKQKKPDYDTADIQLLRHDSLVLRFKDHEQSYYRKMETDQ